MCVTPTFRYLALSVVLALPVRAQTADRFDSGIILNGAWLQATALPLDRDAVQSGSLSVSLRKRGWSGEVGWLRIARDLSTVEGVSASVGRVLHWKSLKIIPAVGLLGGKAYASVDSTGFDWVDAQGVAGHTPRYSYSEGGTFGGSVGITLEVPIYRMLAARGMASQWFFSGSPLEGDRARTLLGVGLSVWVRH
jgi:hypothetical protein